MRSSTRMLLARFAVVLFAALMTESAAAATVQVGTCRIDNHGHGHVWAQYSTIQAAVNAVAPGDTVLVCPGNYPEQVEITKPLTLQGVRGGNSGAAVVVSPPGGLIVPVDGSTASAPQVFAHDVAGQVNISNITVDAANNQVTNCSSPIFIIGVYLLNAAGTIENVVARNQNTVSTSSCFNGLGIRVYGDTISSEFTVRSNAVSAYDGIGILVQGLLATPMIRDNSFVGMGGAVGIYVFDSVTATVSDNSSIGHTNGGAGMNINGVQNASVTRNYFGGNDFGIQLFTQQGLPNADSNTIMKNQIFGSTFDGIDVCGDYNRIEENTISGSGQSGVNLVTGANFYGLPCTSNSNTVSENAINGACAGVLVDPAANGNVIDDNEMFNVLNLQLTGTSCASSRASKSMKARTARVSSRLRMR